MHSDAGGEEEWKRGGEERRRGSERRGNRDKEKAEKRKGVEGEGKLGGAENVCGTSRGLIEGRASEGESQRA